MAGNFRGVLIFVIFVVDLAIMKITTHKKINDTCQAHAQSLAVGVVDRMTDAPAERDTRSYSNHVSGAKYKLMRIDKNCADVSSSLLLTS